MIIFLVELAQWFPNYSRESCGFLEAWQGSTKKKDQELGLKGLQKIVFFGDTSCTTTALPDQPIFLNTLPLPPYSPGGAATLPLWLSTPGGSSLGCGSPRPPDGIPPSWPYKRSSKTASFTGGGDLKVWVPSVVWIVTFLRVGLSSEVVSRTGTAAGWVYRGEAHTQGGHPPPA